MTSENVDRPVDSTSTAPKQSPPLRLVHVVYAVVLLSAGLAANELFAAVLILGGWAYVFNHRNRPLAFVIAGSALFFICFLIMCLRNPLIHPRAAYWGTQCRNNLKQIGLALHSYHDVYGSFPPAVIFDGEGRPLHSWRVLVLPYMDQRPLYKKYDLNQPWDSPANIKLLDRMPDVYRCPSRDAIDDAQTVTSYVAVIGEGTYWPREGTSAIRDATDGSSNSFLIVECDAHNTPWLKPEDLEFAEALELLTFAEGHSTNGHHDDERYFTRHAHQVLLGDGSMRYFPHGTPEDVWKSGLLISDSSDADDLEFDLGDRPERIPHIGNWLRLGLFVLLCLFPLPWVWRRAASWHRHASAPS